MSRRLAVLLLLAGCHWDGVTPQERKDFTTASAALDRAAMASGQLPDPEAPVTGSYLDDTDIGSDRLCLVAGAEGEPMRIGFAIAYGTGGACVGRGTATAEGRRLAVRAGADCAFEATTETGGFAFPGVLAAECEELCSGHASLAGVSVPKSSDSDAEALALVDPQGAPLCPRFD